MSGMKTLFDGEPSRPCGKCTVCCTVMGVDEMDKPMWTRCPDLSATRGCSRYDTRPEGCRKFDCLWRRGLGSNRARPDKTGLVFILTEDRFGLIALVDRKNPNGWKKSEGKRLIDEMTASGIPVFVASPTGRRAFLPEKSAHSRATLEQMKDTFMSQEFD